MAINITGKHIEVGDSLRKHIEDSINAMSNKYFGDPIEAHIVVTKETHRFIVDFSVHISKHFIVRTHGDDADPYRACEQAGERMENRIRRYKSRLRDKRRKTSMIEEILIPAQQYIVNAEEDDKGEDTPIVIAEMTSSVPTLTVGEAVMRMDLSDQLVMMFKNAKHGGLNVVYRRSDGHIGWIDPAVQ